MQQIREDYYGIKSPKHNIKKKTAKEANEKHSTENIKHSKNNKLNHESFKQTEENDKMLQT